MDFEKSAEQSERKGSQKAGQMTKRYLGGEKAWKWQWYQS